MILLEYEDFLVLREAAEKNGTAVITFGRMNPCTTGHRENMEALKITAKEYGGTPLVFLSHSHDRKKNPLTYEQKVKYVTKAAPEGVEVINSPATNMPDIFRELANMGFSDVVVVVGEDREESFKNFIKYAADFGLNSIEIINSGERKPGISGTDMRNFAKNNDYKSFRKNSPLSDEDTRDMFNDVRKGLGL